MARARKGNRYVYTEKGPGHRKDPAEHISTKVLKVLNENQTNATVKKTSWVPLKLAFADSQFDQKLTRARHADNATITAPAPSSHSTGMRNPDVAQVGKDKDLSDAAQMGTLADFGIEDISESGRQEGDALADSPMDIHIRKSTSRTWWITRQDLLKKFVEHLQEQVKWKNKIKYAYSVLHFYYYLSYDDQAIFEEICNRNGERYFDSQQAAANFRKHLVKEGLAFSGPDPDYVDPMYGVRHRVNPKFDGLPWPNISRARVLSGPVVQPESMINKTQEEPEWAQDPEKILVYAGPGEGSLPANLDPQRYWKEEEKGADPKTDSSD